MARPDCPNLYWPLTNLPAPIVSLRDGIEGERQWLVAQIPVLAKGKTGGIVAADWSEYFHQTAELMAYNQPNQQPANSVADQLARGLVALPGARKYYAQTRHLSVDQVSKLDSQLLLATYFIEQYQIVTDEQSKLLGLPLHEAIQRSLALPEHLKHLGVEIDEIGLAATFIPTMVRTPITFGRAQRTVAAMATIEALRAYAAEHIGQFPARLEDVIDTPVPVNPMTGKTFDYRLQAGTATVSDTTSPGSSVDNKGFPLVYTLQISNP
jgi:hypothetical protein